MRSVMGSLSQQMFKESLNGNLAKTLEENLNIGGTTKESESK